MAVTTNRTKNPSFESAILVGDTGAWANGTATVQRETGDAKATGTYCVSVSSSTSGSGVMLYIDDTFIGASYLSVDTWLVSGASDWTYTVITGAFGDLGINSVPFTATSGVQRLVIPVVTATDPGALRLYLNRASATASELRVDAILLTDGAADFFDGNTTDGGGFVYDWTGTPDASTSTRTSTGLSAAARLRRAAFELRPGY